MNLFVDKVRLPQGRVIDRYHVLDFDREAVAAVVENSRGEILMIESYRYAIDSIEWEIPAGLIDPGEDSLEADTAPMARPISVTPANHSKLIRINLHFDRIVRSKPTR